MSVPNLKRIDLFVQKLLGGSRNFEIGSRDPGHAHFGVILFSTRRRGASSVSVPNLKRIGQFVQKLLGPGGSRNYEIRSHDPGHADLGVVLWPLTQGGSAPSCMSVPNLKDRYFCSKVIRGSQISLRHRPPSRGRRTAKI